MSIRAAQHHCRVQNAAQSAELRVKTQRSTALPSLCTLDGSISARFRNGTDISAGTGKRKVDGEYAATRLGTSVTAAWLNERLRQTMMLVYEFRVSWPNKSLLTADDVEYLRKAVDVALASALYNKHIGDRYDLSATTWAIFLVQHVKAVRNGSWTAESAASQAIISFENLYNWLAEQHKRGERFDVKDAGTKQLLHRYKLPFKPNMIIPPPKTELFRFKKGAKRLSDWMRDGGLAPMDERIQNMELATLIEPPPLQSLREERLTALWGRVAARARVMQLTSVERDGEDASLTRGVVSSVMEASRESCATEMTDAEADDFARELGEALEEEPQQEPSQQQQPAQSQPGPSGLSDYELERLANIARNKKILQELGLEELQPPRPTATLVREKFPPGRTGAVPSRSSTRERKSRSYAEVESDEGMDEGEESETVLKWRLAEIEEAACADE